MANVKDSTIFTQDNLSVLRGMDSDMVDLIYLDPPFNSKRLYGAPIGGDKAEAVFKDVWTMDDVKRQDIEWLSTARPKIASLIRAIGTLNGSADAAYLYMMALRLIELKRILKPSGSIYLHCDDTMSHGLKLLMDGIWGNANFRNEIIWKRTTARSHGKRYPRVHDVILFYAGKKHTWNKQYMPLDPEYVQRAYRHVDKRGQFQLSDLTAGNVTGGESGQPWRGIDPSSKGRNWSTPIAGGMNDYILKHNLIPGWPLNSVHERLDALDEAGLIYWPAPKSARQAGVPRLKRYLASSRGTVVTDLITDISKIEAKAKEKTDYPTQKPLALLERLIKASSNEGDLVLDPFCGCATACVAAERLDRRWVGIDIAPKAHDLILRRFYNELRLLNPKIIHRTDTPIQSEEVHRSKDIKSILFGRQSGRCIACKERFDPRHFHVDHIVPKSDGGQDDDSNLQLLCGSCNSIKGNRSMGYLLNEVKKINEMKRK